MKKKKKKKKMVNVVLTLDLSPPNKPTLSSAKSSVFNSITSTGEASSRT
jgi:hypothetical protein